MELKYTESEVVQKYLERMRDLKRNKEININNIDDFDINFLDERNVFDIFFKEHKLTKRDDMSALHDQIRKILGKYGL